MSLTLANAQTEVPLLKVIVQTLESILDNLPSGGGDGITWQALAGAAPDNGEGTNGQTYGDRDTGKLWEKVLGAWELRGQLALTVDNAAAKFVTPSNGTLGATIA